MRGSIRKRSENSWSIRYDGPPGPNGKRTQKEEAVRGTKRDDERLLRQRQTVVEAGTYVERAPLTVREYLEQWLDTYGRTNVRQSTREGYAYKLRPHVIPAIGWLQLRHLRPQHLEKVYRDMGDKGLSPRSILHAHRVVHTALAAAVKSGLLVANPADRVSPPKPRTRPPNVWNDREARSFFEAIESHPYREFYKLLTYTGMRRSEMAGLKWRAVDLDNGHLSVVATRLRVNRLGVVESEPKTERSRRRVSFGPSAVQEFMRVRERQRADREAAGPAWRETGYVFANALGNPLDPELPSREFKRLVKRLGLP